MLLEYDIYLIIAYLFLLSVVAVISRLKHRDTKVKNFLVGLDNHMPYRNGISIIFAEIGVVALFILPGGVYSYGAGRGWMAVGMFAGMVIAWVALSYRIMRYTVQDDELYTLSDFFKKRFNTDSVVLVHITAAFTVIASFIFTVLVLQKYAKLVEEVFGLPYDVIVFGVVFIALLLFIISGNRGSVAAGGVLGCVMLGLIITMAIVIVVNLKAEGIITNIMNSRFEGGASVFFNVLYTDGEFFGIFDMISQLSYGLICFGIPHILLGFFSFRNGREIGKARRSSSIFLFATLIAAAVLGAFARAYLYPEKLGNGERAVLRTLIKMNQGSVFFRALVMVGVCVVYTTFIIFIMRQLVVMTTLLCGDYLRLGSFKRFYKKNEITFSRVVLFLVSCAICFFAFALPTRFTRYAESVWIIIGSTFNSVMIFSLYWKRMNKNGAVAGIFIGFAVSLMWELNRKIEGSVLFDFIHDKVSINGVLPAFILSSLFIVIVSLLTKPCDKKTNDEFEAVEFRNV